MKIEIFYRTLKITIAVIISVLLAQLLNLTNPLTAGIIAILSVIDTRTATIETVIARTLSTVLAFAIASLSFTLIGFNLWAFGIYFLLYIPLAYGWHLEVGLAPCSVLVTHFFVNQSISWSWQINGFLLMLIGGVLGVIVSAWVPSYQKQLQKALLEVEDNLRHILLKISLLLEAEEPILNDDLQSVYTKCQKLETKLAVLEKMALIDYDNQIFSKNDYYLRYAEMRRTQMSILNSIVSYLPRIELSTEANYLMGKMFEEIGQQLHEENTGLNLLSLLAQLYREFRDSPLPTSRLEFESRAILYQSMLAIESFLEIKREFYQLNHDKR